MWFELANEFKTPVQIIQQQITSSEFRKWVWFLKHKRKMELENPSKQDWYLARISYEISNIARMFSKGKKRNSIDKFILNFKSSAKSKRKDLPVTPEAVEQRIQNSKNFWMTLAYYGEVSEFPQTPKKGTLPDHVRQKSPGEK